MRSRSGLEVYRLLLLVPRWYFWQLEGKNSKIKLLSSVRLTSFGHWLIINKYTTSNHWNIHLNVGIFVSFPNWFFTSLLVLSKVFLSSLWPRLYTNKHIVSTLSGFLIKKLSAKNCGSIINQQTTFTTLLVFIIAEYCWSFNFWIRLNMCS